MAGNIYLDYFRINYTPPDELTEESFEVYFELHNEGDPPHSLSVSTPGLVSAAEVGAVLGDYAAAEVKTWQPVSP